MVKTDFEYTKRILEYLYSSFVTPQELSSTISHIQNQAVNKSTNPHHPARACRHIPSPRPSFTCRGKALETEELSACTVPSRKGSVLITELGSHGVNKCVYLHSPRRARVRAAGAVCSPARTGLPGLGAWGRPWPPAAPGALRASPALRGALGHRDPAAGEERHRHGPCGEQKGTITPG